MVSTAARSPVASTDRAKSPPKSATMRLRPKAQHSKLIPPAPGISHPLPPTMHAWAEVYLPGAGWRGLDPTRGVFCDDAFVAVAHASLAESVNPIQGGFYSPVPVSSHLSTHLTIERL